MVQIGQKHIKMVQYGPKWTLMFKMVLKWLKLVLKGQNGQKWSKIVQTGPKMVTNGPKWSKMIKLCQKWSKMVQSGSKCSKWAKMV